VWGNNHSDIPRFCIEMAADDNMSIDKKEEHDEREGSDDSMDSMAEGEGDGEGELGALPEATSQVKRKGGRKPVCIYYV